MEWKLIEDGLPPAGVPLIATVVNHFDGNRRELRYPCYYMKDRFEDRYGWYLDTAENVMLPHVSEVIAWMEFPRPYKTIWEEVLE